MAKRTLTRERNANGQARVVFRIQLTVEAKKKLLKKSDDTGITQIHLTSKLVEWFCGQPESIQAAVLGLYPEAIKEDVATMLLKHMANKQ